MVKNVYRVKSIYWVQTFLYNKDYVLRTNCLLGSVKKVKTGKNVYFICVKLCKNNNNTDSYIACLT